MSVRLGQLISYGNLTGTAGTDFIAFAGTGAISTVKSGWPQRYAQAYTNPLVMAGGLYPVDTAGLSAMPYANPPQVTYEYIFLAPSSYVDETAFQYVADQMRLIDAFIKGTYTLDSVAGVSGQRGWLKVHEENSASGTQYKCKARVLDGPSFELVRGEPHQLTVTLNFGLESEWSAV